ncbi:nitrate transporter CrnA [Pseudovirgaria hyperparasitica]|uniref:Nitrate/nitrite transporter n=1 Tax=Pseudovirgaria hyperparasitica TaxID=470096 RepID=A0A6A6W4Q6_9PEZI|nr:nitrate transporter CrnA [Pseudovirgaria hyperparasitica]KAF2757862.1 nitrate transporter CrnA [Pseudovirgaria hyperparasitica]
MAPKLSLLWTKPEQNPINGKARSIPVLNPVDVHGRVFFFSWLGFLIAFWSWYAFPPLLTLTIKKDLHLSTNEVANSNISGLVATLLVRAVAGPLCDRFGPRKVFASLLLVGALPTALAGTIHNAAGLITLRFFIGILGGTFVPCQVWSMQFFDKNVVGTSNALIGGWGNSGGGITYFAMPAIFDSLVHSQHLGAHVAWRVAFIVPFILITSTAISMLLLCPDTPNGAWSTRHEAINARIRTQHNAGHVASAQVPALHKIPVSTTQDAKYLSEKKSAAPSESDDADVADREVGEAVIVDEYQHEIVQAPTFKEMLKVYTSPQTLALCAGYFNSFGAELAINSILGAYYLKNFPTLLQTGSGRWAAMFGLLNVVSRPLGGVIADVIYRATGGSLWGKKLWIHFVGCVAGIFAIIIGVLDPHHLPTMIGLVAGMAMFMEAGNGANFGLVPHVHPFANGVVSGLVGAVGNLGGGKSSAHSSSWLIVWALLLTMSKVIYAIAFRYHGTNYHQVFYIVGAISIGMNLAVAWIRPVPSKQIGGR